MNEENMIETRSQQQKIRKKVKYQKNFCEKQLRKSSVDYAANMYVRNESIRKGFDLIMAGFFDYLIKIESE